MTNVSAASWYVEVTDPASGYVHEAPVIDGQGASVQLSPKANARPSIRLPVRKADKWDEILGDGSQDVDLKVWHDGVRQPIDTLVDVEQTEGVTVLVGEGGRELKTRVQASFDQKAVHLAAQDLVDNNTTYDTNVDTPTTTTETNTTLATLTTTSDFLVRISNPTAFSPYEAQNGNLEQLQTLFFSEGEDYDRNNSTNFVERTEYSGDGPSDGSGEAERLTAVGEFVEYDFTTDHAIPESEVRVDIRHATSGANSPGLEWSLDGVVIDEVGADVIDEAVNWTTVSNGVYSGDGWDNGDLSAGTHTIRIEVVEAGSGNDYDADCVVLADNGSDDRFTPNYTFDNTVEDGTDGGRYLQGPELYPDEVVVPFEIVPAPQAVTGTRGEATLNGGDSGYTHYLSNDQGANFTSGTGANFETDSLGTAWGPGVTYKAGLSRFGDRDNGTPLSGFSGQNLESLTLKADLEDMPLVVNRTFDDHLAGILRGLTDIGDQLWEYARDGDTESVEWTSPGQRSADQDPPIADYRATKSVGEVYQKAIVYGQPDTPVRQERFESDHGNAVSLRNDRLQQGSERVEDPDSGKRFRRGSDYTMDYQAGEITVLAGGDMADATVFEIGYNHQAYGEFDDGTADPNVTPRIDLPGLWSDFLCKQAARLIINEVSEPIHTAEVTLPNDETGWSVVESIDPDIVPTGGNELHNRGVENSPEATVLTLGSRRSLSDVVRNIQEISRAGVRKA